MLSLEDNNNFVGLWIVVDAMKWAENLWMKCPTETETGCCRWYVTRFAHTDDVLSIGWGVRIGGISPGRQHSLGLGRRQARLHVDAVGLKRVAYHPRA